MDLFFLLFRFGAAMKMIFKISYIPQKEDFKELTPMQYKAMYAKMSANELKDLSNQKVMAFLPDDIEVNTRLVKAYGDNFMIVGEEEVSTFEEAAKMIEKYCTDSGRTFESLTDKLVYMAQTLPDVFSEGTPYAISAKLKKSRK